MEANKIRNEADEAFILAKIPPEELLGIVHYYHEIIDADRNGVSPFDASESLISEIREIKKKLEKNY